MIGIPTQEDFEEIVKVINELTTRLEAIEDALTSEEEKPEESKLKIGGKKKKPLKF